MHLRVKKLSLEVFTHVPPCKILPKFLIITPQAEGKYSFPPGSSNFLKICFPGREGMDYVIDFKTHFLNFVCCLSIPLDRDDQAPGYSICYKGNGLSNLMTNSSG